MGDWSGDWRDVGNKSSGDGDWSGDWRDVKPTAPKNKDATFLGGLGKALSVGTANTVDGLKYGAVDFDEGQGLSPIEKVIGWISGESTQESLRQRERINDSTNRLIFGGSKQDVMRSAASNIARRNQELADATPTYANKYANYSYGGLQSVVRQSPALVASVLLKSPAPMVGYGAGTTYLDKNVEAREAGYSQVDAANIAATHGAIEGVTEFIPGKKLFGDVAKNSPLGRMFINQVLSDVPSEMAAAAGQNAVDTYTGLGGANKGDWQQYRDNFGENMLQAAVGSMAGSSTHAAAGWGAGKLSGAGRNQPSAPVQAMPTQRQTTAPAGRVDALTGAIRKAGAVAPRAVSPTLGGKGWSNVSPTLSGNIANAAQKHGVDLGYMKTVAWIESKGDTNAVSSTKARGIYQFTQGTGGQYGLVGKGYDNRHNEAANVDAAARLARDNAKAIGRSDPWLLYMAHQQGAGGVAALLRAAKNGDSADGVMVGKQSLRANMDVNGGKGMSPSQFLKMWENKYNKADANVNGGKYVESQGGALNAVDSSTGTTSPSFDMGAQQQTMNDQLAEQQERMDEMLQEQQDVFDEKMQDMEHAEFERARQFEAGNDGEVELDGQYQPTQWGLMEADELAPTMEKADNQFRDRSRLASEQQIDGIANNLDYRKLNDSPMMDYGAPMLAQDGKTIIGGNGRVAGIARAYQHGKASEYRGRLEADAGRYGLSPDVVRGMRSPVLVRRFKNFVNTQQAAMASNEGGGLAMSTLEQAKVDAQRLPNLNGFSINDVGELNTAANRDVIRAFVGAFAQNQQASFMGADGLLSQQGMARLRNAMLYQAYGDTPTLSRMIESTDQGSRNVANALTQAAPRVAQAKEDIKQGDLHDADIADDVLQAVEILAKIKAEGGSIREYLAQRGLFGDDMSVAARKVLQFLNNNIHSAKKIRAFVTGYYDALEAQGSPKQQGMFGDEPAPSKEQLIDKVIHEQSEPNQTDESDRSGELFAEQPAREADERGGEPARHERPAGALSDERGQESAGGGSGVESSGEHQELAFSESAAKSTSVNQNQTSQTLRSEIAQGLGVSDVVLSRLPDVVVRDDARGLNVPDDAQAYFDPATKRITMIADRIKSGDGFAVFLHEVFHKRGGELLGDKLPALSQFVQRWKERPEGSIERTVYDAAHARAAASGDYDGELVAYAIEEAVTHGVDVDTATANPVRTFLDHVRRVFADALRKILPSYKGSLSAQELVKIARGAAQLELNNTTPASHSDDVGDVQQSRASDAAASVRAKIADFVRRVRADKTLNESIDLMPVAPEAVAEAKAYGLDIEGYTHSMDSSAVNHVIKNHGNEKVEKARGQIAVSESDLSDIAGIIQEPDQTVYGLKNGIGREVVISIKQMSDNTTVFIEEARAGKSQLAVQSMRKYPRTVSATSILKSLYPTSKTLSENGASIVENPAKRNSGEAVAPSDAVDGKRGDSGGGVQFSKVFDGVPKESLKYAEKIYRNKLGMKTDQNGEWLAGKKGFEKLGQVVRHKWSPLQVAKLVDNKPAEFKKVWRDFVAERNLAAHRATEVAQAGTAFDKMERDLIGAVLTKELNAGVNPPEEVIKIAAEMRHLLNTQTDELVGLGMLSKDSAERWRDTYLPRFYNRQASLFGDMKVFAKTFGQMRVAAKAGLDGSHLKGRGIFKVVEKGEEAAYLAVGYEVRGHTKDQQPVMWRDYTKAERQDMGEIDDGIMRFTAGYMQTQADIAKARLYQSIARNPELASKTQMFEGWVHVPDAGIADTGVKKYGELSGMYVHPEVFEQLNAEFGIKERSAFFAAYKKALGYWKTTKTVYNPVAHLNNVMSNMHMIFMAGGKYTDLAKAVKDLRGKSGYYEEALKVGLVGEGVDRAMLVDMFNGIGNAGSNNDALRLLSDRAAGFGGRVVGGLSALKRGAEKAYAAEDAVFKLAVFRTARERGLDAVAAREYAETFFFDYSDVPVGVRRLRDLGVLPFISYTAKAIPAMTRLALTRPHRMVALVGAMHALNALSYMVLGDAGDEDDEQENMPEYQKGFSVYGVPKMLRLPWNEKDGKAAHIDLARWLPLGDFADVNNQKGGLPIPQWMMPSSPITSIYDVAVTNRDSFTGEEFVKDYQTTGEKTAAYGKWMAQQWLPSAFAMPGSYHFNNLMDGMKNRLEGTAASDALESMGYSGEKRNGESVDLWRAALGAVGIKVRSFDPAQEAAKKDRRTQFEAREIKADISKIRRNHSLTDETKAERIGERQKSLRRLFAETVEDE